MAAASSSTVAQWEQLNHQFAEVADGITLHYIDVGPRDATPVVLVHGWPDLAFTWRHQVGPLSDKFRVIAPDLRGFGRSSAPREVEAYGSKIVTSDLAKLLDHLNLPRAVFVGHDWGGSIVYRMAMYHPRRVLAVASFCTPYEPPTRRFVDAVELVTRFPAFSYVQFLADTEAASAHLEAAPRELFTAVFRAPLEKPDSASPVTFLHVLLGVGHSPHRFYKLRSNLLSEDELEFYVREFAASGFKGGVNYYATRAADFAAERGLPRVLPHPVLYVGAGWDPVLTPELAAHMPRVVPNLEVALVETASHWLLWSHKSETTALLLQWLAKIEAGAGGGDAPTVSVARL
ncbi:hypothetical protein PybrP1_013114 [[Pythium] brassicae (nom. inval.)]|nr:hypothetical protein PybrP1_013114 [[Pythium] brassicae (nom. inval.)]